jgi:hypothetical protein
MMRRKYIAIAILVAFFTGLFLYADIYFSSKPATLEPAHSENIIYHHKTMPVILKNEIIAALSYYPDLKETPIDFVFDPNTSRSVMLSQPVISSFPKGQKNRRYVIKINPQLKLVHSTLPIQEIPKDFLIGWFGHELGHVKDYTTMNNWEMVLFGAEYVCSVEFLMKAERTADTYAVNHGMGDYIVRTKHYILDNADIPPVYKARMKRLYMSPQQIVDLEKKLKKPTASNLN